MVSIRPTANLALSAAYIPIYNRRRPRTASYVEREAVKPFAFVCRRRHVDFLLRAGGGGPSLDVGLHPRGMGASEGERRGLQIIVVVRRQAGNLH